MLDVEQPVGVVVQFGGQTAIKLAKDVEAAGVPILGTQLKDIDAAEDREEFRCAAGAACTWRARRAIRCLPTEEALKAANQLGYPVLVRPSYVLGGQGMEIAWNDADIREYMAIIQINEAGASRFWWINISMGKEI